MNTAISHGTVFSYRHIYRKHISWRQLKLRPSTISGRTRVYSLAFSCKQMRRSSIQRRTTSELVMRKLGDFSFNEKCRVNRLRTNFGEKPSKCSETDDCSICVREKAWEQMWVEPKESKDVASSPRIWSCFEILHIGCHVPCCCIMRQLFEYR